jgi:monoterpene epsilon-lactone hydrolase
MVSPEMQNMIKLLRDSAVKMELTVKTERALLEQLSAAVPLPEDVKCEAVNAGGVPAEWISVPNIIEHNVILHLHSGYYVAGSVKIERAFVSDISRACYCRMLSIDYRLAPENPFPAAVDDATMAYRWLINEQGIDPKKLIIEGLSAGGGLTIACLIKLRDSGDPLPVAAISLCPQADLTLSGKSYKKNRDLDWLSYESSAFNAPLYLGGADPRNPLISPIFGDLKGLPPLLIQAGSSEVLLDDSVRLAKRAKKAKVDVTLDIWKDMVHAFQILSAFAPESRDAIKRISEFTHKFFD